MGSVIVTGGAGYIGSHTIIELLNKSNYRIVSVDNFSNSSPLAYEKIKTVTSRPFETVDVDLCNEKELFSKLSLFTDIVGIIHFAAFKSVPDSVTNPILYYQNNNSSLQNILKFAQEKAIDNFIFSSSCSVYGNADELPVTEQTPLKRAESPYAHTKQIGEEIIGFFCEARPNFKTVVLRYFNPVGAHITGKIGEFPITKPNNLVPIITQTAVGKNALTVFGNDYDTRDGSCIRDYIHVSDVADAHVKAINFLIEGRNRKQISLFNLGTGNGVSVLEAIKSFEKVSGIKLNYKIGARRPGDVIAVYADNTLVKTELKWQAEYTLDDMMLSAWKWQQALD
ncbi:UDP-glucose 4-epimerase GalE [Aurantibacillus circumpalustris]|uniref:UDP-glucose 4-epimerase GalE n=1 Tax=Aurantibacillus circumpalustris TaxID=3036359 RepID=UPI00295BBA7E|nr:UDP-glucose 4-epimerase GalE [Aurantibacillus circumpalustris]